MKKEKFFNLLTRVDEEFKIKMKMHCIKNNISLKKFVKDAVEEKLKRDK